MLAKEFPHLPANITRLKSGPLGGDQQIGARIVDGAIDILIFLTDPMTTQLHDVDVKALVRLCTVLQYSFGVHRGHGGFCHILPAFCRRIYSRTP
jgi:methylglyoxal synthase